MDTFSHYLDPRFTLEERLRRTFDELRIDNEQREAISAFLAPLKTKDPVTKFHYEHSIRVGLLARRIARFMHLDEKALFYAGLMHDVGKSQTCLGTLGKTGGWTDADTEEIKKHVTDGYRFLRDRFDFTAEVIVLHHRFQAGGYPAEVPPSLHSYSEGTKTMIMLYGRILALADVYDALHRINDKFGVREALSGEQIKEKMLLFNPDQRRLITELYDAEIFTTYFNHPDTDVKQEPDEHDKLYLQCWDHAETSRTPRETGRQIMLAVALEPLSDKSGCTTRHRNISGFQKLEYFITGAVNIGEAFEGLCAEIKRYGGQPPLIYHYALRAQKESKRNRRGGRVNQGIIELLTPIVVAQYLHDPSYLLSVEEVLTRAADVLKDTTVDDVKCLREMKRFALDLSGYYDRTVPDYPEASNVMEYYAHDAEVSVSATSCAHNREFVDAFPTILDAYRTFVASRIPEFSNKVADAYEQAARLHVPDVASGFLADCVALMLYLRLSQEPRFKLVT
ncbi:MAG: HD domain-containing protein [Parcubacteria group bacterium]|nr:HD domain-containing protein [Parcubacteria group bacterium]